MTFQGVQCTYAVTYVHGHVPQTTPFRRCLLFNFSCVLFQHYVIPDFETTKKMILIFDSEVWVVSISHSARRKLLVGLPLHKYNS